MTAATKAAETRKRKAAEKSARIDAEIKARKAEYKRNCKDPNHPLHDDPVWNTFHPLYKAVNNLMDAGLVEEDAIREAMNPKAPEAVPEADPSELDDLAAWLATQTWSEFATSLAEFYAERGYLSDKQEASAKSMRAKIEARDKTRKAAPKPKATGLDLSKVPSGYYADPAEGSRLKLRISRGKAGGDWAGVIFVNDDAAYGQRKLYGMQRPKQAYRGDVADVLARVLDGPLEAMQAYGRLVGKCGACGARLEDADSVAAGIGPVCATKFEG